MQLAKQTIKLQSVQQSLTLLVLRTLHKINGFLYIHKYHVYNQGSGGYNRITKQ